jgi:hypothetical protein
MDPTATMYGQHVRYTMYAHHVRYTMYAHHVRYTMYAHHVRYTMYAHHVRYTMYAYHVRYTTYELYLVMLVLSHNPQHSVEHMKQDKLVIRMISTVHQNQIVQ